VKSLLAGVALAAALGVSAAPAATQSPRTWNTELVGHLNPGRGFNGDVWVHRSTAYLGAWGTFGRCPVHGVRAIDVTDSARPRLASRFARFARTTSEDVWVGHVATPAFTGDLAAVGIQRCGSGSGAGFRGLALYDVTTPSAPRPLGRLHSGARTRGVHELSVVQRADGRVLALTSVPHSLFETGRRRGDVRIVDVSDPRRPRELADWDFRRDGPRADRRPLVARRGEHEILAHSVFPFDRGRKAYVSHWDAGEVFLDLADPARPRYLGRTAYPTGAHGNAHSAWFSPDERLFVQNDEVGDFYHLGQERSAWGFQRIFDTTNPARPVPLGTFATESSVPGRDGRRRRDGFYSVHNNVIVGDVEVVSWYSDGVRIVSLADPRRPREIGYFVPPPRRDPQGFWIAPNGNRSMPLVWGVAVQGDLVYASDINSGLWIFRASGLPASPVTVPRAFRHDR
jgi:hypothetical protein